jgi:hypothetical protein
VTAEIKRMYVTPDGRGRAMVDALETGDRLPAAVALYHKVGFTRIPAYGEYVNSPLSVCLGKNL